MSGPENKGNVNNLRVVHRDIVSAYILSEDDLLLMGRQDPGRGGTWPNAWRSPGGGVKKGETKKRAMLRELDEEVIGLEVVENELIRLPITAQGAHEKTLESGETVWQEMDFYHFALTLGGAASEFEFEAGGDLIALNWFNRQERAQVEQISIGKKMMLQAGIIDA